LQFVIAQIHRDYTAVYKETRIVYPGCTFKYEIRNAHDSVILSPQIFRELRRFKISP